MFVQLEKRSLFDPHIAIRRFNKDCSQIDASFCSVSANCGATGCGHGFGKKLDS
jgi:hypothetical protein